MNVVGIDWNAHWMMGWLGFCLLVVKLSTGLAEAVFFSAKRFDPFLTYLHKRTRQGQGAAAPQLWRNFQNSAFFGKIFAVSWAKMLANNGLCVRPTPRFFRPI